MLTHSTLARSSADFCSIISLFLLFLKIEMSRGRAVCRAGLTGCVYIECDVTLSKVRVMRKLLIARQ